MKVFEPLPIQCDTFDVPHPFIREADTHTEFDADGFSSREVSSWRPGVRNEPVYPDDAECVADAMGAQLITVVGTYRPGKFPTRVFFTRQWRDPDGKVFGRGKLHITTLGCFRGLLRGYRVEFRLVREPSHISIINSELAQLSKVSI